MRQLAASEARVAALQQQLHAQTFLPPDSRGEKFEKPRGSYFTDYPLRPRQALWASSPKFADEYCTPVPISTTGNSELDVVVTPLSSSSIYDFACVITNANVCQTVQQQHRLIHFSAQPCPRPMEPGWVTYRHQLCRRLHYPRDSLGCLTPHFCRVLPCQPL